MSELLDSLKAVVDPALEAEMTSLAESYLDGFQYTLKASNEHARPAVTGHLKKAAQYKWKAVRADDEATRRAYAEGVADEMASVKTILKSEFVAVTEEQAATFTAGFERALAAVGSAAKGIITTLGPALVSGAIKGFTGGDGFDPSSIFPGA